MTLNNINAIEYTKAVYELAEEEKEIELIYEQLLLLMDLFNKDNDFLYWFKTSVIDRKEKMNVVDKCFKKHLHWIWNNFLLYLIEKGDEHLIQKILTNLNDVFCKKLNVERVEISSPFEISTKQLKKIVEVLEQRTKKHIKPVVKIDPDLLGGIKIVYSDKYYDGSVQGKLNDLKSKLKEEI